MATQMDTIFKMHSDRGQRKYSLTLEVSCYKKYLKKQGDMCTACAELIIITHIILICDNLLEENTILD